MTVVPPVVQSVLNDRLTYLSPKRLTRLHECAEEIAAKGVFGDILEFGVALGGSAVVLARHAKAGRQFHGFDVFGMIPPPQSPHDDDKSRHRYQIIASGRSEGIQGDVYYGYRSDLLSDVRSTLLRYGMPQDGKSVFLHRGLFQSTWDQYERQSVALAHIDCDWYDPVRFCLEAVDRKLSPGGMIIIDDYDDYGGCRKATDEFLHSRPGKFTVDRDDNLVLRNRSASID